MFSMRAMISPFGAIGLLAAVSAAPNLAIAEPITASSNFTVDFAYSPAAGVTASAEAVFSNFSFATSSVTFDLDVTNTSTGTSPGNDIRLVSLGWVTQPAASAVTDSTSVYASTTDTSLQSTSVSVCLYGGSNCNGGSNGGLEDPNNTWLHGDPSTTGTFAMTINFGTYTVPPLGFSSFISKFQSKNYSSFDADGCVVGVDTGCGTLPPPNQEQVPEPATLLLLGTGLLGLGLSRRARRTH